MKNFLIYRSSAGSGKTFTLVKEYLKLVLNDPGEFKNVLAVTFTNKSAAEMKQRIISALKALSSGSDENLKKLLVSEGVKGDIKFNAEQVLNNILHKYSYFSVSTIDSFFHRVIRSFARELKLQLGYNIELDQLAVLDKITDKLLDDAGIDEELTGFLEDYIYYSIDDEKGWKIENKIRELGKEIFSERFLLKTDGSGLQNSRLELKDFISILFAIKNDFESKMMEISLESQEITDSYSLTIDDFPYKEKGFMNYLLNNIRDNKFEPGKRAQEAAEDIKKWYNKNSKPAVKAAAENGLFAMLSKAVGLYDKEFTKYNTAINLVKTIYVTGIFRDLIEKLKEYRDENNVLLISDINNLLLSVITGDGSPFVYEKIGSYYRNFLIDEFQDTSTFQWRNFFPLIENSLGEGNGSMIVGDLKQSIYRWRNGNMKLLLEDVKNSLSGFESILKEDDLKVNYRSKKLIVNFNNSFFKEASVYCSLKADEKFSDVILKAYKDTEQKAADKSGDGYISIRTFAGDKENDVSSKELAIADMINNIKQQLTLGYRQKDIIILVRKKSEALEAAHALIDANLRVISSESLMLTNSPKVRLLVNLFVYLTDSRNEIAKAEILYNYLVYIKQSYSDLNAIFTDKLNSDKLFQEFMPAGFWGSNGNLNINILSGKSIYALTEDLIKMFGLGNSPDIYLLRFLDVIKKYSDENISDVYGFTDWWQEHREESTIIVPEEEDAIRVMTIHKVKGLQSPVVYIPFANWDFTINPQSAYMWVSSNKTPFDFSQAYYVKSSPSLGNTYFSDDYLEEAALTILDNLNLLYVAFTRAEDKLFIGLPQKGKNSFNAGNLILDTLKNSAELNVNFNAENGSYDIGSVNYSGKFKEADTGTKAYKLNNLITSDFAEKILIKPEFDSFKPEDFSSLKNLKNRGSIIHKALSYVNEISDKETENVINRMISQGLINAEQKSEWKSELREILSDAELKKWFNSESKVMNEREIVLPDGKIYRPDRVILNSNSTIVLDYKSGIKLKDHETQIKLYGSILKEMGYKNIELYLYYITIKKILKVNIN